MSRLFDSEAHSCGSLMKRNYDLQQKMRNNNLLQLPHISHNAVLNYDASVPLSLAELTTGKRLSVLYTF